MKRMKFLPLVILFFASFTSMAQMGKRKAEVDPNEVNAARKKVLENLNSLEAHEAYIKTMDIYHPEIQDQYDSWMKKYPKNATIPMAYGSALYSAEHPDAKPVLEKVVELEPNQAKAYFMLSIDAERWGDFEGARNYMKKASDADPASPDYAFYYASSFSKSDLAAYRKNMLTIPERFPGHERGAQAMYWLALRTDDPVEKRLLYEYLKGKYSPVKSSWASSALGHYYDLLLETNLNDAIKLSEEMIAYGTTLRGVESWEQRKTIAENMVNAKALIADDKAAEAYYILNKTASIRYSTTKEQLLFLKVAAMAKLEDGLQPAYDSLIHYYAAEPTDKLMDQLKVFAGKLKKSEKEILKNVNTIRYKTAEPAHNFNLDNYLSTGKTSLESLKGKVVLVTYWFPGCGPCRGEFPHFENVVKQFSKDNLAYIGINMVHEQDAYVKPFMERSGYSFTPVKDDPDNRGNLVARGAPTNYLIDKEGNIVFKNFRTDHRNERTLELMIQELLTN